MSRFGKAIKMAVAAGIIKPVTPKTEKKTTTNKTETSTVTKNNNKKITTTKNNNKRVGISKSILNQSNLLKKNPQLKNNNYSWGKKLLGRV